MKRSVLGLMLFISSYASGQADTSYKVYYGLLHAHSMICDGSGTPEEAYSAAKAAGLHFFALTPHNHDAAESGAKERKDDVLIARRPELYNGNSNVTVTRKWKEEGETYSEQVSVKPVIKAAKAATNSNFVALYGQEFSTISSSNHVNVLGIDHLLEVENGDFKGMLAEVKRAQLTGAIAPVIQLNHPDVSEDLFYHGSSATVLKNMHNDYGIDEGDLGPHFNDWVRVMQPYTHLIEVLSGPAMAKTRLENYRYPQTHENDYFLYLMQGLHVAPSAGQDNHYKTWGTVNDARTGIIARDLSATAVYDAFRKHRTFVAEDKNLSVVLYVNNVVMGSSITAAEETELDIKALIRDADEPAADYEVYVYAGEMNAELGTAATNWKASDGKYDKVEVHGNGLHSVKGVFGTKAPTFYYIKIVQENGDRAWTAPVWVNETHAVPHTDPAVTTATYYWTSSASSRVYHSAGCSAVERIRRENLHTGNTPPEGRTQHACNVVTPGNH